MIQYRLPRKYNCIDFTLIRNSNPLGWYSSQWNVQVQDVTCGDISEFYTIGQGLTYSCTYFGGARTNWDVCILTCDGMAFK